MASEMIDRTDTPPAPNDSARRRPVPAVLRRLGATHRRTQRRPHTQATEELEAELTLLREENARLKVKRRRARDRPVNERVRELLSMHHEDGGAFESLADCWLLRDDLIDACREIERSVRDARTRLEAIDFAVRGAESTHDELEPVA